ncbi:C-type lectin domain family 12 member B [Danio aesculapii]|uniref:C-type lectin domain family 12 member B n=1 Tax=Danio aesculapii TaxID=1142201 RepID=UPI0024BFB7BF|nr:C-type lectin domain family 12 member B [Danio aesculapii]
MTKSEIPEAIYQNINTKDNEGCLDLKTHRQKHQPPQLTGSISVKSRKLRALEVCLGLLCALLLTAVIVLCVYFSIQRKHLLTHITELNEDREQLLNQNNDLTEEREQILKHNDDLTEERKQLLTNITNLNRERERLLNHIENLTKEREQLRNDKWKMWPYEQDLPVDKFKWICYNNSFYFISSEMKSWSDSRRDCQQRKADLAIIKSTEEKTFFQKVVDRNFWIGLTKTDVWKWLDGTVLTNGSKTDSSNCAVVAEGGYYTSACNSNNGWICEKTHHY